MSAAQLLRFREASNPQAKVLARLHVQAMMHSLKVCWLHRVRACGWGPSTRPRRQRARTTPRRVAFAGPARSRTSQTTASRRPCRLGTARQTSQVCVGQSTCSVSCTTGSACHLLTSCRLKKRGYFFEHACLQLPSIVVGTFNARELAERKRRDSAAAMSWQVPCPTTRTGRASSARTRAPAALQRSGPPPCTRAPRTSWPAPRPRPWP